MEILHIIWRRIRGDSWASFQIFGTGPIIHHLSQRSLGKKLRYFMQAVAGRDICAYQEECFWVKWIIPFLENIIRGGHEYFRSTIASFLFWFICIDKSDCHIVHFLSFLAISPRLARNLLLEPIILFLGIYFYSSTIFHVYASTTAATLI